MVSRCLTFDGLLPPRPDRAACRREFGFADDEFVVLVFGLLRSWDEVRLVRKAFDRAGLPAGVSSSALATGARVVTLAALLAPTAGGGSG